MRFASHSAVQLFLQMAHRAGVSVEVQAASKTALAAIISSVMVFRFIRFSFPQRALAGRAAEFQAQLQKF